MGQPRAGLFFDLHQHVPIGDVQDKPELEDIGQ